MILIILSICYGKVMGKKLALVLGWTLTVGYCALFVFVVTNYAFATEKDDSIEVEWLDSIEHDLYEIEEVEMEVVTLDASSPIDAVEQFDPENEVKDQERTLDEAFSESDIRSDIEISKSDLLTETSSSSASSTGLTDSGAIDIDLLSNAGTDPGSGSSTEPLITETDQGSDLASTTATTSEALAETVPHEVRSRPGGGLWHIADTWEGGVVPREDDVVVITEGTVSSYFDMLIHELRIEEGATYRARNSSNLYEKEVEISNLVNSGHVHVSSSVVLRVSGIRNEGSIDGNLVWAGGRDSEFETTQLGLAKLTLESDLETELSLVIEDLQSKGHTIYVNDFPTLQIKKQSDGIHVSGESELLMGSHLDYSYRGMLAPESNVNYKPGHFPESLSAKTINFTTSYHSGRYRIVSDISIHAELISIGEEATLSYYHNWGNTRTIQFYGDVINDGYLNGTLEVEITGNFLNLRSVTVNHIKLRAPENATTYRVVVGDNVLSGETGQFIQGLGDDIQSYVQDKDQGAQVIFYENGIETAERVYLNIPFEQIENP
jgi:hypothetical protein